MDRNRSRYIVLLCAICCAAVVVPRIFICYALNGSHGENGGEFFNVNYSLIIAT